MGYARVFWIREAPIRRYLAVNGQDDPLIEEIGHKVLSISADDSYRDTSTNTPSPQPFLDQELSFYPFRSFHSTDSCLLVWTGQRLEILSEVDVQQFDFLCQFQNIAGPRYMVTTMPKEERDLAVAAIHGWDNPLRDGGELSIYWIYEDFTRDYTRRSKSEWPCKDVGLAVAELMFSNWNRSQNIRNHGNALSRACTFLRTEMCVFVWAQNCLRPLGSFGNDETEKMRSYLASNE